MGPRWYLLHIPKNKYKWIQDLWATAAVVPSLWVVEETFPRSGDGWVIFGLNGTGIHVSGGVGHGENLS